MADTNKRKVISVRLDEESLAKLQEIQSMLSEKLYLDVSYADAFQAMIKSYHQFLNEVDKDKIDAYIHKTLLSVDDKEK